MNTRRRSLGAVLLLSAICFVGAPACVGEIDPNDLPNDPLNDSLSSAAALLTSGPIFQKWQTLGGAAGFLGSPVTDETATLDGRGRYVHFQGGSIYWTPSTGAHEVHGEIRWRWSELGWERSALGYPTSDEVSTTGGGRKNSFERGEINWAAHPVGVTFFAQNMALLAAPAPYKGTERTAAKQGLIDYLRSNRPGVVGLSEVFVDGERSEIRSALSDIYPFFREGPDESDLESDGGLLLLSQFPILASDQTIYRACFGEDCLANKGVLMARIDLPGVTDVDVYLTHLQSPDVQIGAVPSSGPGSNGADKVKYQLTVLSEFVAATRNRAIPALVMGDINTDGQNDTLYADMMARLGHPTDAWLAAGNGTAGITSGDPFASFLSGRAITPASDPRRFQSGSRLDYIFGYDGSRYRPSFSNSRAVVVQSASGRDVSDHYGVLSTLSWVRLLESSYTIDPSSVTTRLTRFHCLLETDGPIAVVSRELSADEVEFQHRLTPSVGTARTSSLTSRQNNVVRGVARTLSSPPTVTASNPGSSVTVRAEGWEVDAGPFGIVTGRASLGAATLGLHKNELFDSFLAPIERRLRLKSSAGGEYIVTVSISAR